MKIFRLIKDKAGIYIIQSKSNIFPFSLFPWFEYYDTGSTLEDTGYSLFKTIIDCRDDRIQYIKKRYKLDKVIKSE